MTTENNIFSGQTTGGEQQQQQQNNVQNTDSFTDLLGSIKNERGEPKYKDIHTALDALRHSQEFIPQLRTEKERLEQEADRLRQEVQRLQNVEKSVEQLTSQQQQQVQPPAGGLSEEAIADLVSKTLSRKEQETVRKNNLAQVVQKAQETFGAEAEKVFYNKAKEMGMTQEGMNSLAAQSPSAVLQLLGIKETVKPKADFTPSSSSTVNTAGYQPQNETFIGRNNKPVILGATSQELRMEKDNAGKLVEELHSQGLSTYDLTDPKQYFKYFGQSQ